MDFGGLSFFGDSSSLRFFFGGNFSILAPKRFNFNLQSNKFDYCRGEVVRALMYKRGSRLYALSVWESNTLTTLLHWHCVSIQADAKD